MIAELATVFGFALLKKSIILKSISAVTARIGIMTVANYYLLQLFYYPIGVSVVVGLLAPIALFNVTQALINIIPAYHIYMIIHSTVTSRLH